MKHLPAKLVLSPDRTPQVTHGAVADLISGTVIVSKPNSRIAEANASPEA
jgi:hypothetical protein